MRLHFRYVVSTLAGTLLVIEDNCPGQKWSHFVFDQFSVFLVPHAVYPHFCVFFSDYLAQVVNLVIKRIEVVDVLLQISKTLFPVRKH